MVGCCGLLNIKTNRGFTIVELLIVIVVIGILAAITVVAFNGVQDRANNTKIKSDLSQFQRAILAARSSAGELPLKDITVSTNTASNCVNLPSDANMADTASAAACWSSYASALNRISIASGINIRDLKDPWGRPYFLDENEQEGTLNPPCGAGKDSLGAFPRPRLQGVWTVMANTQYQIPYITPG
ncbi:MAG: type II secretion system protein [Chloroflexi bacterium]|nr:MAG: type II secretion system protein [Chloroflexota bacterium]